MNLKTIKHKSREVICDPGFLFNTGYLATFSSLIFSLGWLPLIIMSFNWLAALYIITARSHYALKKTSVLDFLSRNNAALALNGSFLTFTGLVIILLSFTSGNFMSGNILTAILSLGFGISNIQKAAELDNVKMWLAKFFPFLQKIKSEILVGISSLCICLMTGGWSLITLPIIFYATKLGEEKATNPKSSVYRLTTWIALSKHFFLPQRLKSALFEKHPLAISRLALMYALLFSSLVGTVNFSYRYVATGVFSFQFAEFAVLGNICHALATYSLYRLTDQFYGSFKRK